MKTRKGFKTVSWSATALFLALFLLFSRAPTRADTDPAVMKKQLQAILNLANSKAANWDIIVYIELALHLARGPQNGLFQYHYAEVDLDNAQSVTLETIKVTTVGTAPQLIEGQSGPFIAIDLYVPKTMPNGAPNEQIYLESFGIAYIQDGKSGEYSEYIKKWLAPGETKHYPMPGTAVAGLIRFKVGTTEKGKNKAVVEIRTTQPEISDSNRNPYNYVIRQLIKAREIVNEPNLRYRIADYMTNAIEDVDSMIPKQPTPPPVTTNPQPSPNYNSLYPISVDELIRKLEYIKYLMSGTSKDRSKAQKELGSLIDQFEPYQIEKK